MLKNHQPSTFSYLLKGKAFTLIELLVVVAIIAVLLMILLPALGQARQVTRRSVCLSNLRQMNTAIQSYVGNNNGFFPPALDIDASNVSYGWDFIVKNNKYNPGLIWDNWGVMEIQQCPGFDGSAMSSDKFTGYNYNSSYLGWAEPLSGFGDGPIPPTARIQEIQVPSQCAVFGDGQYEKNQANKYMRSPFEGPLDAGFGNAGRYAGTQGFRHVGTTNVGFADGHAESRSGRFTNTYSFIQSKITPNTGFLSPDNSLYDLK